MKPHIAKLSDHWHCWSRFSGVSGTGKTPRQAYIAWAHKANDQALFAIRHPGFEWRPRLAQISFEEMGGPRPTIAEIIGTPEAPAIYGDPRTS